MIADGGSRSPRPRHSAHSRRWCRFCCCIWSPERGITDTPLALTWQITALVTAGLLCLIGVTTLLGEHNSRLDRVGALAARLAAAAISAVSVWTVATEFSSSGSAVTAVACVALPAATWLWWIASTLSRGHDRHSDVADDPHSH
ncbi:hypothetical protein [Gordonia jinhuaensis]|uniref:Uncharacterized protein n=1 Tax=Gordonia jinhuaensis TaxID=1517702 RepID=A0A916THH1_9ACTN|nr:hypothetical protein [Gordonia jinhuaensis]GGB42271.1 hypothetical protein GCM10011489_32260 [Gordonia jinhuaensis]